jgi:hypothetical protein
MSGSDGGGDIAGNEGPMVVAFVKELTPDKGEILVFFVSPIVDDPWASQADGEDDRKCRRDAMSVSRSRGERSEQQRKEII